MSVSAAILPQEIERSPEHERKIPFNFRSPMDNLVIRTFHFPTS